MSGGDQLQDEVWPCWQVGLLGWLESMYGSCSNSITSFDWMIVGRLNHVFCSSLCFNSI